jgi:hypothetical protein
VALLNPALDEVQGHVADLAPAVVDDETVPAVGHREAGEVTGEIDPRFALLVAYAVIFSPITMPQFVRDIFGSDPLSPAIRQRLHSQLIKLLGTAAE